MIVRKVHGCNAVHLMDLSVTDGSDCQLIPLAINKLLIRVTYFTHNFRLAVFTNNHLLKSFRNNSSPFLCIEHAVELLLRVQVRLISFHHKAFWLTKQFAAILHAGIIAGEANLHLQNEVAHFSTLPDEKRVCIHRVLFCGLPHNGTFFNRPKAFFASPAR